MKEVKCFICKEKIGYSKFVSQKIVCNDCQSKIDNNIEEKFYCIIQDFFDDYMISQDRIVSFFVEQKDLIMNILKENDYENTTT